MIIIRASGTSTESPSSPASDFTTDLSARYLFTSDTSDSLGNYDTMTKGSAVLIDSSNGAYFGKSGSTSRITLGSDSTSTSASKLLNDIGTNDGTISFWLNPDSNQTDDATSDSAFILGSYAGSTIGTRGPQFGYFDNLSTINNSAGGWHFWSKPGTGAAFEGVVWEGDSGTGWVHIAFTYDSATDTAKLYKDGSLADTQTFGSGFPQDRREWIMNGSGANPTSSATQWAGWFKDLSIWDGRILTADEISDLYDNSHGGSY